MTAGRHPPEQVGPTEVRNPLVADEIKKAAVWLGMGAGLILAWWLAQPILLIVAALVLATMLDGGARLLGRVLKIGRGWRLLMVTLGVLAFLVFAFAMTGAELAGQFETLRVVVMHQADRAQAWAASVGVLPQGGGGEALSRQIMGSIGQLTSFVGSALGAISSAAMILVLGLFLAIEPNLYERGLGWMVPLDKRDGFYRTTGQIGRTLRLLMAGRLLGMAVEGVFTWIALSIFGVPMALALGLITGILAFLPNIGAIVSGVLTILVGFSAGTETGIAAVATYVVVQVLDGYIIVPMVAKKSVDLAPALVLGAQILFGALFGILGLALADPIVAMIKVALERRAATLKDDGVGAGAVARA